MISGSSSSSSSPPRSLSANSARASAYYGTYHGHSCDLLDRVLRELRSTHRSIVFFAGDSSLDNKYWFGDTESALNGYENVLIPPRMKCDVCYWLNREMVERGASHLACVNTAVEATSLNDRSCCHLLEQDRFIRDSISNEDYLVVSVGGNDVALAPLVCTIVNILLLVWCAPQWCIENAACGCPPNARLDLGCAGCGMPGCLTASLCGWPPGLGYFIDLFCNRVQNYVERLVSRTKPKKVFVCMIYFLDELSTGSWADCALNCMCYDYNPSKLQAAIRTMYRLATSRIQIPGTEVVFFPLFEVLDGKTTSDYTQRVEPSVQGGQKMASALLDAILSSGGSDSGTSRVTSLSGGSSSDPEMRQNPVPMF